MPKTINRKCASCAKLQIAESREQTCWVEGKCNNTRNYYRTRDRKLETKRRKYAEDTGKSLPTQFEIVPDIPRASPLSITDIVPLSITDIVPLWYTASSPKGYTYG